MTVTDVDVKGLNFIRGQEGRALRAYQDSVGVWTIGYGITNYDKGIGFKVKAGATITADEAEWLLYQSLRTNYLPDVERVINQQKVSHPQGAINGGLSMHFNTGGILKASWPRELNAGNLAAAKAALESWDKAGGRVLSDLVRRRAAEWQIISVENYGQMTGPETEDDRGRANGHATLLTALPTQPGSPIVPSSPLPVDAAPVKSAGAPGVLKAGATGGAVIDVQNALTAAGYPTSVTGTYDPATEAAVTDFQKTHSNLLADGKTGPATAAALTRAADLRKKAATGAKIAASGPVVSAGLWHMASADVGMAVAAATIVFVAVAGGVLVWRYRHDVMAVINKAIGRVVP